MNKKFFVSLLVLAGVVVSRAQVMDFQVLEHNDANIADHGVHYEEDGYQLDKNQGEPFNFATFGTQESRYPGSTAMFNNTVNGNTIFSKIGGGSFTVFSIALDHLNSTGNVVVTFTGTRADNTTNTESFTTDNARGLQTFSFANMTNLVKMEWLQGSPFHQFDNINVVPEPATMVALGIGVAALARRRRK